MFGHAVTYVRKNVRTYVQVLYLVTYTTSYNIFIPRPRENVYHLPIAIRRLLPGALVPGGTPVALGCGAVGSGAKLSAQRASCEADLPGKKLLE